MIDAENLTYAYPDGTPALVGVRFHLEEGKKYALVGPNGAGKSTLLSLLCALEFPTGGSAVISGLPLDKAHASEIRGLVGMVFQNPDDQLFMPTVYDDVAFGLKNQNLPAVEVKDRADAMLRDMGLEHLKDRPPYRLSGGEKRQVALATALVMKPRLLLMDEPTAFLDPRSKRALVRTLEALPVGLLIATHDLPFARALSDGVLILKGGHLFAQGGPELLDDTEMMKEALLDDE
jgi:cobalt/nickel transport system ATP-binding protein